MHRDAWCWADLTPEQYRERIAALVEEIDVEARADREARGVEPLGVEAILRQDPHTRPNRTKKSPAPAFHAATKAAALVFSPGAVGKPARCPSIDPKERSDTPSERRQEMCERHSIQCIIPPYINDALVNSPDPQTRSRAIANMRAATKMRTFRVAAQAMPTLMASMSPTHNKHRLVYDAQQGAELPGALVRSEGDPAVADSAVNEAYDFSGDTYDFYNQLFQRNSLDDNGMTLISSVHVADVDDMGQLVPMNNAFWNGEQMAYGDGDGVIFRRFTRSLDVVGHELTHGVESFTSNLNYFAQSGALNEHFADVFGILVRQRKNGETAAQANWVVGADVLVLAPTRRGIRDMENPGTAFVNDPDLGTDPQPAHMANIYLGPRDRRGVHINSGIPNRAFVLAAKAIGGNAWDTTGRIWYDTMLQLSSGSQFLDCAKLTVQIAAAHGAAAKKAVKAAWKKVGIPV